MRLHNEYAQENPRINRQDRLKITFHGSANLKEILQQCTPLHTEAVDSALPGGPLGGLPSLSLTTEGSWIHLGGGSPNLFISPLMSVPPDTFEWSTVKLI